MNRMENPQTELSNQLVINSVGASALFNAMSGRNYTDPEQLTITTLDNAIYMSMKNDIRHKVDYDSATKIHCLLQWHSRAPGPRVRTYAKEMPIEDAVERAINECIQEGILRDFLLANKAEAKKSEYL